MSTREISVLITATDRVTPVLVRLALQVRELRIVAERAAFLLRNTMRRKPQGLRPKHHPRRRRGR